jgi:hypothetical protein
VISVSVRSPVSRAQAIGSATSMAQPMSGGSDVRILPQLCPSPCRVRTFHGDKPESSAPIHVCRPQSAERLTKSWPILPCRRNHERGDDGVMRPPFFSPGRFSRKFVSGDRITDQTRYLISPAITAGWPESDPMDSRDDTLRDGSPIVLPYDPRPNQLQKRECAC